MLFKHRFLKGINYTFDGNLWNGWNDIYTSFWNNSDARQACGIDTMTEFGDIFGLKNISKYETDALLNSHVLPFPESRNKLIWTRFLCVYVCEVLWCVVCVCVCVCNMFCGLQNRPITYTIKSIKTKKPPQKKNAQ